MIDDRCMQTRPSPSIPKYQINQIRKHVWLWHVWHTNTELEVHSIDLHVLFSNLPRSINKK